MMMIIIKNKKNRKNYEKWKKSYTLLTKRTVLPSAIFTLGPEPGPDAQNLKSY